MYSRDYANTYTIILSGGIGSRLKGIDIPKQYYKICGRTILSYCLEQMEQAECINGYVVTAAAQWQDFILQEMNHLSAASSTGSFASKFLGFALPGKNRQQSILHGLQYLKTTAKENDIVLIQDAVRPLTSKALIENCVQAAISADGAMPILPMTDTVYYSKDGKQVDALLDRDKIIAGQAPEAFVFGAYLRANESLSETDMLSVRGSTEPAIKAGMRIALLDGDERNFKITTEKDLKQFKKLMEERNI